MNGTDTVIVRRGEDLLDENQTAYITVYDSEGNRYLIGLYKDDYLMTHEGAMDEINPEAYNCGVIDAAYVDNNVPEGNWLILKWLKDNYNFDFTEFDLVQILNGENIDLFTPEYTCNSENVLTVGISSDNKPIALFNDYAYFDDTGLVNCQGDGLVLDASESYDTIEILPLDNLSNGQSSITPKAGAIDALILMLGNHMHNFL